MEGTQMKVTLIDPPVNAIQRIYINWHQSRCKDPLLTVSDVNTIMDVQHNIGDDIKDWEARFISSGEWGERLLRAYKLFGSPRKLFQQILRSDVPVAESVQFLFAIENMPIVFREQLVRHRESRVHKQNAYWIHTSRIGNMSTFFDDSMYFIPEEVVANHHNKIKVKLPDDSGGISDNEMMYTDVGHLYEWFMHVTQQVYNALREGGMTQDGARMVLPVSMLHRGTITVNMRNLIKILKDRSCWIAHHQMWHPIVNQMVTELVNKVDPVFEDLKFPPCFSAGRFMGCPFPAENTARYQARDPNPPCMLWMKQESLRDEEDSIPADIDDQQYFAMKDKFIHAFWPGDVFNWYFNDSKE